MTDTTRPTFYYLWKNGKITIRAMTDEQAYERYKAGERWHGVGHRTREAAEQALQVLLAEPPPQTE